MYHHHSQQQGSQSFSNGPRPPHHQPPPNQHQNRSSNDMLSQAMGFQFPRPTQLPDELESALAIRGARDMDHRLIDHMNRPTQHQNQSSASGISQHGSFGSNSMALASENQPAHQQGVDWSSYQPPTKLFSSPPPGASHHSQRQPGPQQQPQSGHAGARIQSWKTNDSQSPQARHPLGSGDNQGMYTPESAGSILASFGLSNEDLEVLSHYPDDQLTPDTLPFILRDIQINKTGTQNTVASPSFTSGVHEMPLLPPRSSRSPEVPSLLTVTQTAGKVIDYGHASRAKEETSTRKTFKREQLSTERIVKMYPTPLQSSPTPKPVKAEKRQVRLEHAEPSKHGDKDYRRTSSDHRKISRSPEREFQPSSKPRDLDQDYRRNAPKPRPSSETRKETTSRRSLSSSSGSKPHSSSSSKKLPTPTMISDFSAVSPKVYPHTCSLCHTQCDQEKDWVDHINTVNHTAACRDLRNKYPDWKPTPSSGSGRHGSRGSWDAKGHSPSQSVSRPVPGSLSPSPPHSKHRVGPPHHRLHGRPYLPHHLRYPGGPSHSGLKRTHDESTKLSTDASRHLSSSRTGHGSKHGPSQSSTKTFKSGIKPGLKTKTASSKAADPSAKPPPAKKKKKVVSPAQDWSVADRLVYLTGIPKDASEQEVTDLVGSFGRINNVILMPCSEEDSEKDEGQKASVCMMKAEDAQALANCTNLSIREQQITASTAKAQKSEEKESTEDNSKPAPEADKGDAREGAEADLKMSEERGVVLIMGLPESGWSESDIISLVQPFGTPFDIIMATQIGRVLLSVPDMETAQEMVKVHSFRAAKIRDTEVQMTHIKQNIGLSTPVALYNLLMASGAPLECPAPVGWSSLLVISNVPSTPSGPSEVQKLVRRFGTVIKTLVLNSMVICEMATAAMALSVYKRFQSFPCIIQNNPLFFSRKADPRANSQSKVITAYLDPTEETPANGKSSKTTAAVEEEMPAKEDPEPPSQVKEKDFNGKEEKLKSTEEVLVEDKALGENQSKDQEQEVQKEELTAIVPESVAAPDTKPEADSETSKMERAEEKKDDVSSDGRDKSAAGEETKTSTSDGRAASKETPVPDPPGPPKASLEMVDAPQEESQTSTVSNTNNSSEAPANGKQEETQPKTKQAEKPASEPQQPTKNQAEEAKKQERERKEKERKEREKRERERRAWESKERARKERERDDRAKRERERREEERREREKRERKRVHGEGSTGWRSSSRSDGNKRSSEKKSEAAIKKVEEEQDEFDEFPFNMSDFVTVDEVGDVTELPDSPLPAAVPMETTEEEGDAATSVQKGVPEETPAEANTEAGIPCATASPVKSEEPEPEPEAVSEQMSSTPDQLSDSPHSHTVPTCQPAAPETETKQTTLQVGPLTTPADSSSISPEGVRAKDAFSHSQDKDEKEKKDTFSQDKEEKKKDAFSQDKDEKEMDAFCQDKDEKENKDALIQDKDEKEKDAFIQDKEKEKKDAFSQVKEEEDALSHSQDKEEKEREDLMVWSKTEERGKMQEEEEEKARAPAAETGKHQRSEDNADTEEDSVRKKLKTETPAKTDHSLPPFDPSNPVGMEFLVPKTGFFCKVCNRFFSGNKEAEISHCKTLKHYESLQKFLQTRKTVDVTTHQAWS